MKACNDLLEVNENGKVFIQIHGNRWKSVECPKICFEDYELSFDCLNCEQKEYKSGIGEGIRNIYSNDEFCFETIVWQEYATDHFHFELIPINFDVKSKEIIWPSAFEFDQKSSDWFTLLTHMQGLMIPNDYENECISLNFDGQLCSNGAYMPWFSQVRDNQGYLMICETYYDGKVKVDHPANGPYTHISFAHLPSLSKLAYRREIRLIFQEEASLVSICKLYRQYVKEKGRFVSLKEKAIKNPNVDRLIGSAILHKGIKTHVSKDSEFYDSENIEKNDVLVPFEVRCQEIERYHEMGIEKLYLHLDGWGDPGYDNQHPDYLPACQEAGGWEGLRKLSKTLKKHHDLFGLHDQYRDYYFDAKTFDREYALMNEDGSIFEMSRWAGGHQSYLCASQAPYYVKRNFEEVLSKGIELQASYLDVFTCNEPDECFNPHHLMNRRECLDYRRACFDYLNSKNILPSSEEVNDWAIPSLVFAHYGPYDFMLREPNAPRKGIGVPLFNLVYHDCVILPWPMDAYENCEDYMLYALLNGGAAYVDKDGAYPNVDGAFDDTRKKQLQHEIDRYKVVASLQEKVAKCEMVDFGFMENYSKQYSCFEDGTRVEIDLKNNTYQIM